MMEEVKKIKFIGYIIGNNSFITNILENKLFGKEGRSINKLLEDIFKTTERGSYLKSNRMAKTEKNSCTRRDSLYDTN